MTARPLKYHQRGGLIALFGQPEPRDAYQGTQPPAVAVAREPARLLSVRATGRIALVLIEDAGQTRLIRATTCDQPELDVLSPTDRATIAAAVATLHREGGPADAA